MSQQHSGRQGPIFRLGKVSRLARQSESARVRCAVDPRRDILDGFPGQGDRERRSRCVPMSWLVPRSRLPPGSRVCRQRAAPFGRLPDPGRDRTHVDLAVASRSSSARNSPGFRRRTLAGADAVSAGLAAICAGGSERGLARSVCAAGRAETGRRRRSIRSVRSRRCWVLLGGSWLSTVGNSLDAKQEVVIVKIDEKSRQLDVISASRSLIPVGLAANSRRWET